MKYPHNLDQHAANLVVLAATSKSIDDIGRMFSDYERVQKECSYMTKMCDEKNARVNELERLIVPKLEEKIGKLEKELRILKQTS